MPLSVFDLPARDIYIPIIDVTPVGDWQTLMLSGSPVLIPGGGPEWLRCAVTIEVTFWNMSGLDSANLFNNLFVVGGKTFCMGSWDDQSSWGASTLDARLPIIAPYVSIGARFPASQDCCGGMTFGAWLSNEPSYGVTPPACYGQFFSSGTQPGSDSLFPQSLAGFNDTTRGYLVPAGTVIVTEFAGQTLGQAHIAWQAEAVAAPVLTNAEYASWVVSKSADQTNDNTFDALIYPLGNNILGAVSHVPLNGFRQGVAMYNATAPPRDIVVHLTGYQEFTP